MTAPRPPIALRAIDSHTGGEPTRLIVDGFPDLGGGSMAQRRDRFARDFDRWRQAVILEPRGNDVLSARCCASRSRRRPPLASFSSTTPVF